MLVVIEFNLVFPVLNVTKFNVSSNLGVNIRNYLSIHIQGDYQTGPQDQQPN